MNDRLARWLARVPPAHRLLLIGLAMLALPHLLRLPAWLALAIPALLLWRLAHDAGRVRLPSRFVLIGLVVAAVAGLYVHYRTLIGRDAGSALLLFLIAAKLLEMHRRRDVYVVLFLADFLIVVGFLFEQSLPYTLWMGATLLVLLAAQIHFARHPAGGDDGPLLPDLRLATRLLLQSLPLAVVLFLFFPRPGGPLWGMPEDALGARTGLSATLSPGRISHLSDDDAVAFRVRFRGPPPPPGRLYWRGLVHVHFDGRSWYAPRHPVPALQPTELDLERLSDPVSYTVTLEPHDRRWLFFLDAPLSVPLDTVVTVDRQVAAPRPVIELMRYTAISVLRYRLDAKQRPGPVYLAVPDGAAPRTRALAGRLRATQADDLALVKAALDHLRTGPFFYSRQPPPLVADPIDGFLFDTRIGFCEHYAAAFAVLLRLAGIPARVVSGYQGGEPNPLDDYLIVRQSDAHAWVEAWLAGQGWVRIDPTAVIPAERILEMPERLRPRRAEAGDRVQTAPGWLQRGLRRIGFVWDMLDERWNQWILGFDRHRQIDLLQRLGIDPFDWRATAGLLGALALLALAGLLLYLHWRDYEPIDPAVRIWRRLCRRLARHGLVQMPGETPRAFGRRCVSRMQGSARDLERIVTLYLRLRYARDGSRQDLEEMQRRVRSLELIEKT